MKRFIFLAPVLLGMAAAGLTGCGPSGGAADAGRSGAEAPVPVTVAVAAREDVPLQARAIGWVEPYASVTVRPQVEGQLTEIHFAEGQHVKAGDRLFTIDSRPSLAELRLAEATLAKDRALAQNATQEAQRLADLFRQGAASDRERDQSQAQADALQAQVQADEAAVENARLRVEYCTLRAPLDGRVGARLVDRGNIVKANETALVVINQLSPIYVRFSVAEQHLARIKQYMREGTLKTEAALDDGGPPETGTLSFLDNQVDTATGMVRLKATFTNETLRLWPGRFVNVTLTLTTDTDAVVVPAQAVQPGPNGLFVFVIGSDGAAQMRAVEPGRAHAGKTVIRAGVEAGETVVTDGQLRLTPGAKVKVISSASPSAAAPAAAGAPASNPAARGTENAP